MQLKWVDFLQTQDAVWDEFKADIEGLADSILREIPKKPQAEWPEMVGAARGLRRLLDLATAKEREAYARSTRTRREATAGAATTSSDPSGRIIYNGQFRRT